VLKHLFLAALISAITLALASGGTAGTYADPPGDGGVAGDITNVSVEAVPASNQVTFRITGRNLATSTVNPLNLGIDSDANASTGDPQHRGADYWFFVDEDGYWFLKWNGADWADTAHLSVEIFGDNSLLVISVNVSEIGGADDFNFYAWTEQAGTVRDSAPNQGVFNYSVAANGPRIDSVDFAISPPSGPKAGKQFIVTPGGLHVAVSSATEQPESYSCVARLRGLLLPGRGTGRCTFVIPRRNSRGKRLAVLVTVSYQGVTKTVPLAYRVA
jgi:hypothetical protein